jgi:hypothetical protein
MIKILEIIPHVMISIRGEIMGMGSKIAISTSKIRKIMAII